MVYGISTTEYYLAKYKNGERKSQKKKKKGMMYGMAYVNLGNDMVSVTVPKEHTQHDFNMKCPE